ncbi:MAG: pyridoxal phosphate-dependent aminotransferase family protein [Nitrospirae bacterium]|nr:pyridoxal phosphate-dependent aminotransferase family protein [Nitrospirota bacterium]
MDSRLVQDTQMALKNHKEADIFEKCRRFTAAKEIMDAGIYPYFRMIESAQDPEVVVGGRKMIMIGSNNYLGLTNHPRVKEAAIEAVRKYGSGCAGSRFLSGTLDIHVELEKKLARFMRKEAVLVFSTGFQTNLGVIASLAGKDDIVLIDKMNHASIIDGCRLSFGEIKKYKHNDIEDLERLIQQYNDKAKLIIVDGVFSMEGDIVALPEVVRLAKKYGTRVMVDDAHGIGVLGRTGRGTSEHFGLEDEVDLIMGTYSKSLASIGGFIAGSNEVIHYIKHFARAFIFSASPPPASVASVSAAIDIIEEEPERIERLWHNTKKMLSGFKALGFDTGASETPIIPVIVGDDMKAFTMARMLHDRGVFANVAVSPAVPNGKALIRTSYMATHSDEQLDKVLKAFEEVGKILGII